MQVIGICRFSYPGVGGFQVEHDSIEERIAFLYDPARLEERFRYFECFTLPCLRAQTDPDFTFLIVIGDQMPPEWRSRLDAAVTDLPQAVIQAHPPGPHRDVMKAAINAVKRPGKAPNIQFRLDDDDAVAVSFVARLRRAAEQATGLLADHRHVAIDFFGGHIARPGPHGLDTLAIRKPFWTAGLGVLFRPQVGATVMNFAHQSIGRKMPTLGFSDPDMMLRGHSDRNDSRQADGVKTFDLKPLDKEGEALFHGAYNIDADAVRQAFRTPPAPFRGRR